jgi:Ca2+-binding EF-hand superfamily protein
VTFLAPFGEKRDCFAYACARDVAGVGRLPADGDPAKSMGVVAHPGPVLALVVSEVVVDGDAAEDDGAARGSASARVFTLGGGGVGVGDGDDRGSVISVWRVDAAAARRLGDDASTMTSASFSKKKVEKSETVAARRTARLLEGGARGALAEAARDAFAFAQLKTQGEDATRDRAVDTRRGTVPVGEVAGLMRALGLYLTEREVNDVAVELRYEAELAGANVPTEVDFDRFLALYVNRRPPRDVGAEDVREAFEIILDGEGDAVSRESLIEMLKTSGEAMSDEELAAVAKALGGEEAGSVENLFPEAVTAKSFAENILGFRTVEE